MGQIFPLHPVMMALSQNTGGKHIKKHSYSSLHWRCASGSQLAQNSHRQMNHCLHTNSPPKHPYSHLQQKRSLSLTPTRQNLCKMPNVSTMGRMPTSPTLPTQVKCRERSWFGPSVLTAEKRISVLMRSTRKN